MTTTRGIAALADAEPGRTALIHGERRVSFAELEAGAASVAHRLAAEGVGHGDRVAVRMRNRPELFMVWNGCARLGALVVPVGYALAAPEVAHIVEDSGALVCVHDDPPEAVTVPAPGDGALRSVLSADDASLWSGPGRPPSDEFLGSTVVTMPYTSGTTGRPKGIVRAAPPPAAEAPRWPVADFWGFTGDDVHLLCGPAYHTAPGNYAQMSMVEGAAVVVMSRFEATECLRLIERHRVTTTHMVPANFVRILEADWAGFDRGSLRRVLHAAAPCPVAVKRRIMEVFPADSVWEYYGASEGMATVISPQEWRERPGSVGRPFPGVEVAILDDQGRPLPSGEVGTVYLSSRPGREFAYHNDPEKTAAAWRDGMFSVGDLGHLDADGYLHLADRRTDLIITGGVNVYPAEVERALAEHPDVVDSAVLGLPDERFGQRVHAVVELRPGSAAGVEGLLLHLQSRLAPYKLPRAIDLVAELPREPNGKVLKRRLREQVLARTAGAAT